MIDAGARTGECGRRGAGWVRRAGAATAVAVALTLVAAAAPAWASIANRPEATWQTNGRVDAIVDVGGITYLGGSFTRISDHSGTSATVSNLAALDSNGNLLAGWAPQANHAVKALAADGSDILAGGAFTRIDGHGELHLALLTPSGALRSFAGHTNGEVEAIAVANGVAYVGGTFTKASGTTRAHAAGFAASGGKTTPWNPDADARVDALAQDGGQVILGGMFTHVGGHHAAYLTSVDATTGAPGSWASSAPAAVLALTAAGGSVYAGIGGKGGTVAAYAESGGRMLWRDQTDGNVQAITTAGGEVIPGGHFNNFCDPGTNCAHPVTRHKIAALDERTGSLDPGWHPSVNSKLGVFCELGGAGRLEIGGDFTKIAGVAQAHYAVFGVS
jgi:hypothetical protein